MGTMVIWDDVSWGNCTLWTTFKDFLFLFLFLERGEGRLKESERNIDVGASRMPPTRDLACNPGTQPSP